jgi:NADH:ubiquinone oxidoreductase subunit 6 (subunit J)
MFLLTISENTNLIFFFLGVLLFTASCKIFFQSPVHSLFFLILTFIVAAFLLFLLKLEFMATVILIVYAGAIAMLFLFIIMMLDLKDLSNTSAQGQKNTITGTFFWVYTVVFFFLSYQKMMEQPISSFEQEQLSLKIASHATTYNNYVSEYLAILNSAEMPLNGTREENLGYLLYTTYAPILLIGGFILLVGIVGVVFLTEKDKQ